MSLPMLSPRRRCVIVLATLVGLGACDGPMYSVSLTAEDFRFVPEFVRMKSSSATVVSVYNAGREIHEFDSMILMYAKSDTFNPSDEKSARTSGMILRPGQTLRLVVAPPPGTYLYICRRKGHQNMTGTFIVE